MKFRAAETFRSGLALTVFVLMLGVIGLPTRVNAQVMTTTRISGTVTDPSGAMIPDATVTVKNESTGATRSDKTNTGGSYSFPSLLPGTYTVRVSKSGFKTEEITGRTALVAEPVLLDVVLQVGTTSETITVSAAGGELISTSSTEISATINPTLVSEIPLARQDFFDLLTLTPGTVPQHLAPYMSFVGDTLNFVTAGSTYTESGIWINGQRDSASNVSVDGSNVQTSTYQQTTQLQSPADIEEVHVESGSMAAEFGSGVNGVNVITKAGTNHLHGEVYEYLRNNHLDAVDFFSNLYGEKNPLYEQNQFGGAVGGPIKKDKLFFFGNYEGFRVAQNSNSFEEVPPAGVWNGDFTGLGTIYNPYQYNAATGLRTAFPLNANGGSQIPTGPTTLCAPLPQCVDPVTYKFLQQWVLKPNTSLLVGGVEVPEHAGVAATDLTQNQYTSRVDWSRSSQSTIYGRITWQHSGQFANGIQPLEGTGNPFTSANAVIHWTKVFTPSLVNDLMVGYTKPSWGIIRQENHGNVAQEIGMTNVGNEPGGPVWDVGPYAMDSANDYLLHSIEDKYQFRDDLSYVRGRHTLKFGAEIRNNRFYYNVVADDQGSNTFDNSFTAICPAGSNVCNAAAGLAPGAIPTGGNVLADYFLGIPSGNDLRLNPAPYTAYQWYDGFYAQDTWRVSSKLTANYGLRYEYWRPWLDPRNITGQFNESTGQLVYALQNPLDYLYKQYCYGACAPLNPGVPREAYKNGNLDFAPRVGLTYLLTSKTVVKAGFGIYYDGNTNTNQFRDPQTGMPPFNTRVLETNLPSQSLPLFTVNGEYPPATSTGEPIPNDNPPDTFRAALPYYPTAAVDQWSFNVQRQLSPYWSIEGAYIGSHTVKEYMFEDLNSAILPAPGTPAANLTLQQRRIFPQWGQVGSWIPIGYSKYNGATLSLTNREWHSLTLVANFAWAKAIASSHIGDSDSTITNLFCRYCLSGEAQWVPKVRGVFGYHYTLPFGRGKSFGNNLSPVVDKLVSGWAFSGTTEISDGSPQLVTAADFTGTALIYGFPNRVAGCNPNNPPGGRTWQHWFNQACFTDAPYGTWPNAPMGDVTFPGINNWDISITKDTHTGFPKESGRLQFKMDLFNAWNHTQFNYLDDYEYAGSPTFGEATGDRPPRIIQFSLRYFF